MVDFSFLDGDVPRSTSYGVFISQLIRFARASSHVADFNTGNKLLTQKLLQQGYRYHKLHKFSKFYRQYYTWYLNCKLDLNLSCDKEFRKPSSIVTWCINWRRLFALILFSAQFIKIISHYKKICYNINACLVVNPITVGNYAFLFNCTHVSPTSDSMMVPTYSLIYWWDGRGLMLRLLPGQARAYLFDFFAPVFSFMYCWVLIFALSPFYILICMF